jgi:hypothetical protein
VGLANLGSESETCVESRVRLVGVSISFEKNFYRLPFTPPSPVRCIGPSEILFNSIVVPPYVLSLSNEDAHFFRNFYKLMFHIISDIKVYK